MPPAPTRSRTNAAKRAGAPRPNDPASLRSGGVALALLKDFYWIELGIRSYLRTRGNPEFSRADGMVLANITLGFNRPSDIARQLGVSRQAIHRQIQQMKEKGIVSVMDDPSDGRIKLVVVTDLARKMNEDGVVAMTLLWEELGRRIGQANLNRAAKVLASDWGPPVLFD
jgi:DNA-binding MarR family transcriptional regulator